MYRSKAAVLRIVSISPTAKPILEGKGEIKRKIYWLKLNEREMREENLQTSIANTASYRKGNKIEKLCLAMSADIFSFRKLSTTEMFGKGQIRLSH